MIQYIKKIIFIGLLFLQIGTGYIGAQNLQPQINYVSVVDPITLKINWARLDVSIFDSYILQYAKENDPFVDVQTLTNIDDTVYLFTINENEEYLAHNFRVLNNDVTSGIVQAVSFVHGSLASNKYRDSFSWKAPYQSAAKNYTVQRKFEDYNWEYIGETSNLSFVDSFETCDTVETYHRVFYTCVSDTAYSFKWKHDHDAYDSQTTILDTVSILDDNRVAISWKPLEFGFIVGYRITYGYKIPGGWYASDSTKFLKDIYGTNVTYFDTLGYGNPDLAPYQFVIQAIDSCGNIDAFNLLLKTIFLETPELNTCAKTMKLNWNPYTFHGTNLSHYKVYIWEDDILVKDTITTDTTYTYHNLVDKKNYRAFIRAVDNTGQKTSSSNRREAIFHYPDRADSINVTLPSIVNDASADFNFYTYPQGNYSSYVLKRSTELLGEYEVADTIGITDENTFDYSDAEVDFDATNYYYKIEVMDSCAVRLFDSEPVSTLNINGVTESRQINSLTWNNVENSRYKVLEYNIYRTIDGVNNPTSAIFSEVDIGFKDDLYDFEYNDYLEFSKGEGLFEYRIEAVLDDNSIVHSNILELEQITEIFIPNAFTPGGANPVFKPVSIFIQDEDYSMYIYNKWGALVFESHDKNYGWDGTYNGQDMPQDSYAFYIKYKDSTGAPREKKGVLTLIR